MQAPRHRPSPGTLLHAVDPGALRPRIDPHCDAQVLWLLTRVGAEGSGRWTRRDFALYFDDHPRSAALARALADRMWLRERPLLPPGLGASYWAGALDQLGRQHAGEQVLLVAGSGVVGQGLRQLLQCGRARPHTRAAPGLHAMWLDDGTWPRDRARDPSGVRVSA